MNTCVICGMACDPFCDEDGNILIDFKTGICRKCQRKIENGEIIVEDYDNFSLEGEK